MNRMEWATNSGAGRAAISAFGLSVILVGWTLVHAIRIETVPEFPPPQFASAASLAAPLPAAEADVEAAVETDLFAADRSAPERQYRAPGEDNPDAGPTVVPVLPVVLGTAAADAGHSFATVQLGDSRAVILHIGDKIGEYTVQSIGRERVVFTNAAKKKLDIPALKP